MAKTSNTKLPPVPKHIGGWIKFAILATLLHVGMFLSDMPQKDLTSGFDITALVPPAIYWLAMPLAWFRKKDRDLDYYLSIAYIAFAVAAVSFLIAVTAFRIGNSSVSHAFSKSIGQGMGVCIAATGFCLMELWFTKSKK